MAINKRKILQSAQKHMQKGALEKALKDYASLLEADPKDVNIRLKVGDIHLKQGRTDEAVDSYLKVAERFMKDGFDSKAIALYKQVTKIDPKRYDVYLPLSELYQRLGLSSDAMKALQTAADAHYREGNKDQALDLLRKMATLDPSNTTNRLKVAELLRHEGRLSEALAEYEEVVEELGRQGDSEERVNVLKKILDVDPSRMPPFVELVRALVDQKKWGQAEATAETMIDAFPGEPDGYELLAEIYQKSGREDGLPGVYRRLAEVYKDRGDEDHAREIMQRFVSTEALGAEENGAAVLDNDDRLAMDAAIGGGGTFSLSSEVEVDPGFIPEDSMRLGDPIDGLTDGDPPIETDAGEVSSSSLPPLPPLETEPVAEEEVPEAEEDPEQLFAEASVYLRYGKHERAIESLRGVLSRDPGHRRALEKLGEALALTGDTANAATAFGRAAEAARAEGDEAGFESLRAKTEELDPAAAANLAAPSAPLAAEPEFPATAAPDVTQHILDIGIDSGVEEAEADEALTSDDSIEFEIEDDLDFEEAADEDQAAAAQEPHGEEQTADFEAQERDLGDSDPTFETVETEGLEEEEVEVPDAEEPDDLPVDKSLEETVARQEPAPSQSTSSATTPQQMIEDLEEADFYFQQGLHDEAEEVYRRILNSAPNHPQAMLRLGEIEAARSEGGAGPQEPGAQPHLEPEPEAAADEPPAAAAPEAPVAEPAESFPEPAPSSAEEQDGGPDDFGIDLSDASSLPGLEEEAALDLDAPEAPAEEPEPATAGAPTGEPEPATAGAAAGEPEVTHPLVGDATVPMDADAAEFAETGDFDLAAELSGAFDGEDTGPLSGGRGGTTEEEGFEQVFAAFKQGVERELGDGDFEAHYDLGIAYKEMGLLDDAIGEFQIALGGASRKLASLHAMGLCALELERVSDAIAHLEQALALPEVPAEQQTALHFDLGRAYHQQGDLARARGAYQAVADVDPHFGRVGERIAELERIEASGEADRLAPEADDETFESFDDLIEGIEPEPDPERYESFDDLISESAEDGDAALDESVPPPMPARDEAEDPPTAEFEVAPALVAEPFSEARAAEPEAEAEPYAEPAAAQPETEAEPYAEPAAAEIEAEPAPPPEREPEAAPQGSGAKKPGRRKKISFV